MKRTHSTVTRKCTKKFTCSWFEWSQGVFKAKEQKKIGNLIKTKCNRIMLTSSETCEKIPWENISDSDCSFEIIKELIVFCYWVHLFSELRISPCVCPVLCQAVVRDRWRLTLKKIDRALRPKLIRLWYWEYQSIALANIA